MHLASSPRFTSRPASTLFGMALLAASALLARPAPAAQATFTAKGPGAAVTGTVGTHSKSIGFAGILEITIDGGPTTQAYCIDINHPISIGDTQVSPGSVVIDSDPVTRAFEQGRAGGAPKGVPRPRSKGSAIIASAVELGLIDTGSDAEALGLKETAPRVRIVGRACHDDRESRAIGTCDVPLVAVDLVAAVDRSGTAQQHCRI